MESGSVNSKSEGLLSRMALNDNKAGMEGLDRDKINKIIMETSKVNTNPPAHLHREIRTLNLMWITISENLPVCATIFATLCFMCRDPGFMKMSRKESSK